MATMMMIGIAAVALWVGGVNGFVPVIYHSSDVVIHHVQKMAGSSDLPYGPPMGGANQNSPDSHDISATDSSDNDENDGGATLRGNRFSKYAPDASLETADFREQLKNNMKEDLERRRREDPNRGNQPAKTYLDNL